VLTRSLRCSALLCLLAATGLVAQGAPRVTRLGNAKSFGRGIVQATLGEMRLELSRTAEVIVLQVDAAGGITPIFPTDSQPGARPPGVHVVTAPVAVAVSGGDEPRLDAVMQTAAEVARSGRAVRPPAVSMGEDKIVGYWLVVVSDAPTTSREVRGQLESMTQQFGSVEEVLKALPGVLIANRTKQWGAFYSPVY
jgi:hypothetical protein